MKDFVGLCFFEEILMGFAGILGGYYGFAKLFVGFGYRLWV